MFFCQWDAIDCYLELIPEVDKTDLKFCLVTDDDLIQDFLWMDCCRKITDKVKPLVL